MSGKRVYVSSTFQDLKEFRAKVNEALQQSGFELVAMENYPAFDERPLDKCLKDVASSDYYVGILAWRYGFVPDEGNPDRQSITELEYHRAGDEKIPRFVFLLDPEADWKRKFDDQVTGEGEDGARVIRFRELVEKRHGRACFTDPEELARKVLSAVQRHGEKERPPRPAGGNPHVEDSASQARFVSASVEWKRTAVPDATPRRWVAYVNNDSNAPISVELVTVNTRASELKIDWGPIRPSETSDYELEESQFDPLGERPEITTRFTDSFGQSWVLQKGLLKRVGGKSV